VKTQEAPEFNDVEPKVMMMMMMTMMNVIDTLSLYVDTPCMM